MLTMLYIVQATFSNSTIWMNYFLDNSSCFLNLNIKFGIILLVKFPD